MKIFLIKDVKNAVVERFYQSSIVPTALLPMIVAVILVMVCPQIATLPVLDDFVVIWGPANLLRAGINPYNQEALRTLLTQLGWPPDQALLPMFHPPLIFTIALPFSLLSYPAARFVWLIFQIVLVFSSVMMLADIYQLNQSCKRWALLLAITSFPFLRLITCGQMSGITLFAVVLLIKWQRESRGLASGLALMLLLIKPQVCSLFLLMGFWSAIRYRTSSSLIGIVFSSATFLLMPMMLNPNIVYEWISFVWNNPPVQWATPTIGTALRLLFGTEHFWLQFVTPLLAILSLGLLILKRHIQGHKMIFAIDHYGPLLLLLSLLSAPYAWEYDYVLLLPLLIQALSRGITLRSVALFCTCITVGAVSCNVLFPPWYLVWIPIVVVIGILRNALARSLMSDCF